MKTYKTITHGKELQSNILYNDSVTINPALHIHEIGTHLVQEETSRTLLRDSWVLHFISAGQVDFMGKQLAPGTAFVMFPHEFNRFCIPGNQQFTSSWIQLSGSAAPDLLAAAGITPGTSIYQSNAVLPVAELLRQAVFDNYETVNLSLSMTSVFYRMLAMLAPLSAKTAQKGQPTRTDQYLFLAVTFLKDHYADDITPADIAKSVNLNTNYLCRLFREHFHKSIKAYLTEYRVNQAKTMLAKTDLSIREISNAVGYCDSAYFSQLFKHHTSLTPSAFRNEKRK